MREEPTGSDRAWESAQDWESKQPYLYPVVSGNAFYHFCICLFVLSLLCSGCAIACHHLIGYLVYATHPVHDQVVLSHNCHMPRLMTFLTLWPVMCLSRISHAIHHAFGMCISYCSTGICHQIHSLILRQVFVMFPRHLFIFIICSAACFLICSTLWEPAYDILVPRFRPKTSFSLPYQRHSSSADCVRELL